MKKAFFIILGFIGLGLGALGAALPLLPAFPFLMLAAFCFGKSSEKLDTWFKSTNLYKNNLETFVKGEGMTMATKRRILTMISILMMIGFLAMGNVPVGRIILCFVWVFHIVYFIFFIKTIEPKDEESLEETIVETIEENV